MFRKLTLLALLGGAAAYLLKNRGSGPQMQPSTSPQQASEPAPADLAEVRPGQTQDTVESPAVGVGDDEQAVIPDVSNDDPLVREQEAAAAADAGSIGGDPDTVTADADPEMRPVIEGSGDSEETFETTDEQGR
jgi:cytoskeletal protein RodZ